VVLSVSKSEASRNAECGSSARKHPVDSALDQSLVIDPVDIVRLDALVDAHELLKLFVIGDIGRRERAGRDRNQSERSDERQRGKEFVHQSHGLGPGIRVRRLAAFASI
jgi:hypothetical protein